MTTRRIMLIRETCEAASFHDAAARADFTTPPEHAGHHAVAVDVTGVSDDYCTSIFDAHMRLALARGRVDALMMDGRFA